MINAATDDDCCCHFRSVGRSKSVGADCQLPTWVLLLLPFLQSQKERRQQVLVVVVLVVLLVIAVAAVPHGELSPLSSLSLVANCTASS